MLELLCPLLSNSRVGERFLNFAEATCASFFLAASRQNAFYGNDHGEGDSAGSASRGDEPLVFLLDGARGICKTKEAGATMRRELVRLCERNIKHVYVENNVLFKPARRGAAGADIYLKF